MYSANFKKKSHDKTERIISKEGRYYLIPGPIKLWYSAMVLIYANGASF